jgi:hypothetical protein
MIGALINAGVGLFSSYQQRKAAQKNRDYQEEQNRLAYERSLPFDSESAYGSVDFDPETRKMVQTLSPEYQKLMGDWLGISGTASSALQNMMSDPYAMEQEQFKRFEALNTDAYNQARAQGQEAAIAQGRGGTQGYYDQMAIEDAIGKDRMQGQLAAMQTGMDYRNMLKAESLGFGEGGMNVAGMLRDQADLGRMVGQGSQPAQNMLGVSSAGTNYADTKSGFWSGLVGQSAQYNDAGKLINPGKSNFWGLGDSFSDIFSGGKKAAWDKPTAYNWNSPGHPSNY